MRMGVNAMARHSSDVLDINGRKGRLEEMWTLKLPKYGADIRSH